MLICHIKFHRSGISLAGYSELVTYFIFIAESFLIFFAHIDHLSILHGKLVRNRRGARDRRVGRRDVAALPKFGQVVIVDSHPKVFHQSNCPTLDYVPVKSKKMSSECF